MPPLQDAPGAARRSLWWSAFQAACEAQTDERAARLLVAGRAVQAETGEIPSLAQMARSLGVSPTLPPRWCRALGLPVSPIGSKPSRVLPLAGRRIGDLLVMERAGSVQFGHLVPAWKTRCLRIVDGKECGTEEIYPVRRLVAPPARPDWQVLACRRCRLGRRCEICGAAFIPDGHGAQRTTCGASCEGDRRKRKGRRAWQRRIERNPDLPRQMAQKQKQRRLADEEYAEDQRRYWRDRDRLRRQDPEKAEQDRASARAWYARNAERVQAERREKLDALSLAERLAWLERARRYQREYRARWRKDLAAHPERHQEYLDYLREYRRQKGLAQLLRVGEALIRRRDES